MEKLSENGIYVVFSVIKEKDKLAELKNVVLFALSIPSSNVYIERLFLVNDWSGRKLEISGLLIWLRAENVNNIQYEFTTTVISRVVNKLMDAPLSAKKYKWKHYNSTSFHISVVF